MERETGFEPATPSLEGSCSSQLSYSRQFPELRFNRKPIIREYFSVYGGEGRIRTSEALRRQIYSLLPLATREPLLLPGYVVCSQRSLRQSCQRHNLQSIS